MVLPNKPKPKLAHTSNSPPRAEGRRKSRDPPHRTHPKRTGVREEGKKVPSYSKIPSATRSFTTLDLVWISRRLAVAVASVPGPSSEGTRSSDVLGRASSPEPAELSPFKPKPSRALIRACRGLGLGFRFQKPEPEAQARALIHCGSMQTYDQKGNIKNINV